MQTYKKSSNLVVLICIYFLFYSLHHKRILTVFVSLIIKPVTPKLKIAYFELSQEWEHQAESAPSHSIAQTSP